jgi:hypothetical protein
VLGEAPARRAPGTYATGAPPRSAPRVIGIAA